MLALRSLLFAILIPGAVAVLIPSLIVTGAGAIAPPRTSPQLLSLVAIAAGAAILIWCIWNFASNGRGTLAPVDPPKQLVVQGPYRYVRNPMYLGVLLLLLGQTAYFRSITLLQYTIVWFIIVNVIVVWYEEPALRRRFGERYERYVRSVHRWWPTRAFRG